MFYNYDGSFIILKYFIKITSYKVTFEQNNLCTYSNTIYVVVAAKL